MQQTGKALTSITLTNMVKGWCTNIGLRGNFGSHTLRKAWGYHQRHTFGHHTVLLTVHSSETQTLDYLCIQPEEINDLYVGAL